MRRISAMIIVRVIRNRDFADNGEKHGSLSVTIGGRRQPFKLKRYNVSRLKSVEGWRASYQAAAVV